MSFTFLLPVVPSEMLSFSGGDHKVHSCFETTIIIQEKLVLAVPGYPGLYDYQP